MKPVHGVVLGLALLLPAAEAWAQGVGGLGYGRRGRGEERRQQQQDITQKPEKQFPLGSSWIAVSLNGKPISGERPAFTVDKQFRARGFGGCNNFSATAYPLREQGLAVGPLALTRKQCDKAQMERERAFLTALRTAQKWESDVGTLVLKSPGAELRFERSI